MSSATEVALEPTYLPAAISSVKNVLATLLRWTINAEAEEPGSAFEPGRDISGIIAFTGVLNGTIVISFDKEVAFCAVEALLGDKPTVINSDVGDTVAELSNMVAGGVKEFIKLEDITLGMPATISGTGHSVFFDSGATVERTLVKTPVGCMTIQIAVRRGNL